MSYLLIQLKLFSNVAFGLWWCHRVMVLSLTGYFPLLCGWVALLILMLDDVIFRADLLLLNFSCVISILYLFPAAMCPSSGELLYQCDTWFMSLYADDRLVRWFMSLCVDDRLVCIPEGHLHTGT